MASSSQLRTKSGGFYVTTTSGFEGSSPGTKSSSPTSAFASSSFSRQSSTFKEARAGAASPPRLNTYLGSPQSSPSIRFSIDRPKSPGRSIFVVKRTGGGGKGNDGRHVPSSAPKKACTCAPTTHPGSFRCSLHRKAIAGGNHQYSAASYSSSRSLNFRRSAMTNSLVRICGVEGDLMKRALSALIRPSSLQIRRRLDFQQKPSRFRVAFLKSQEHVIATWKL